jgi:hypothetical protein
MTPETPTPETDLEEANQTQRFGGYMVKADFARRLERRAIAAEARAKELESKIADVERRNYDTNRRLSDVLAERAALRLRPIAEAGPVPDGAVRIYGQYSPKFGWTTSRLKCSSDTHFIDIYPPQQ